MPITQLVLFGCWLLAALAGGALLLVAWERLQARSRDLRS
jgi:hypothetical protein